eukprot:3502653-Ditylum_brightwellii.AAC.1
MPPPTLNLHSSPPGNWRGYMQLANGDKGNDPETRHNKATTARETTWARTPSRLAQSRPPSPTIKTLRV